MRRRLLTAILLIATVAVAGFGVPLAWSVHALYRDEALLMLSEQASRAAVTVPVSFAEGHDLPELPPQTTDVQVALYGADGTRLVGRGPSRADAPVLATLRDGAPQRHPSDYIVTVPINNEATIVGAIRTSSPPGAVTGRTLQTWAMMAALALAVLAAAGVLAARRSRHLTRPLDQLRGDADVLGGGGELPARPVTGVAEIDAVHAALTQAATRLNDSLARERSFSADVAHQLRTPLASLRLRLETEDLTSHAQTPLVRDTLIDVDRLKQTIDDLMLLARDTEQPRNPHPLTTVIQEAATRWKPQLKTLRRQLIVTTDPDLPQVSASPSAIRQILDVLIDNALNHSQGHVTLSSTRVGPGAVIAVTDNGTVTVDPEQIFIRRRRGAAGSGIGLALARRLAEAEGMRLVLTDPGPGVVFHLIVSTQPPPPPPPPPQGYHHNSRHRNDSKQTAAPHPELHKVQ